MISIEKMSYFFRYDKVKYKIPVKFPEIAEEIGTVEESWPRCKRGIHEVYRSVSEEL